MTDVFDHVLVGAGTAGSVLAARLAEAGGRTVCVLEAGPRDLNPFIHIPAGMLQLLRNPVLNWMYRTEPGPAIAGRRINQARGRGLGGSGSINGHIYNRGHRMDFDSWAQRGNAGWSYAEVLPYFRRSERRIGPGDDLYHGRDGAFAVTDLDGPDPLCEAFIESAVAHGIPRNPDYNGAVQEGVGYAQRSIHRGRRVSAARAFLHPAMRRGGLDVRACAHATRILFEGRRAVGVEYVRDSLKETVRARAGVVLCGGSIASPQLLQLSGVGPPDLLQGLGIPVVHALPGVGENLRDHYAVRLTARVRGLTSINERVRGLALARELLRYAVTRDGALTLSPTLVYCFWKSEPALDRGDIQVTFTPASYPGGVQSGLDRFPGATVACWQQRPDSAGYVRALSPDPFDHPAIQPNYLAAESDRRVLLAALRLGRRLLHGAPLAQYVDEEIWPGPEADDDDDLLQHARETGNTAYHPIGTCRMGPAQQADGVVDAALRVHGLEGLHVADASIMPTITSANTNAASLMIGEKAADLILDRPPLPAAPV